MLDKNRCRTALPIGEKTKAVVIGLCCIYMP